MSDRIDVASWSDGGQTYWQAGRWDENGRLLEQADARDTQEEAEEDAEEFRRQIAAEQE